jgi:hypothetical protein
MLFMPYSYGPTRLSYIGSIARVAFKMVILGLLLQLLKNIGGAEDYL